MLPVVEPLFWQLLVVRSSIEIYPSNCLDHSNNIFKAQGNWISILEVRAGESFGFKKTPFIERFQFSAWLKIVIWADHVLKSWAKWSNVKRYLKIERKKMKTL